MTGNVFRTSRQAMQAIMGMHFPGDLNVVDMTFGLGAFWNGQRLTGVDLRPTGDIRADNRALPFAADAFDVGVIDPPFKRGPRNARYTARYGEAPTTVKRTLQQYHQAIPEALRVARRGMVIKVQDTTDGHAFCPAHILVAEWVAYTAHLRPHDIAWLVRTGAPDSMIQGTRHFLAQRVSVFLIYQWTPDRRPVRF